MKDVQVTCKRDDLKINSSNTAVMFVSNCQDVMSPGKQQTVKWESASSAVVSADGGGLGGWAYINSCSCMLGTPNIDHRDLCMILTASGFLCRSGHCCVFVFWLNMLFSCKI